MKILQTQSQVDEARKELDRRKLSYLTFDGRISKLLHEYGILKGIRIGDRVKSWDVLETVQFIEENVDREMPILDIGAYASEVLCILHRLGYRRLVGVDLNEDIRSMPYGDSINWQPGNFLAAPFPDESFQVVTAISVIEHGFDGGALFAEMSRLLRPEGFFIASFDYWPDKIDTSDTRFFGMDWRIFSALEVEEATALAKSHGLSLLGSLERAVSQMPITTVGHSYTFAWIAFRKAP